ncbi:MAG: hemin uptake protein HemP [Planctomycetaceae bacterium]
MPHDRQTKDEAAGGTGAPSAPFGDACPSCGVEVDRQGVRTTTSQWLLGAGSELRILHNGDVYRLTRTRSGKLILHK